MSKRSELRPEPLRPDHAATRSLSWSRAPDLPTLGRHEVHIWRTRLDCHRPHVNRFFRLLARDEITRAQRFHFADHRDRFIIARGSLRIILGSYLRVDPAALRFNYCSHGKPSLAKLSNAPDLSFNLSHSGDLSLYGIGLCRQIGIDVEQMRPEFTGDEIARRFFSPGEVARLFSLPADVRPRAFLNCWTRKEAFVKAKAVGLSFPLDQFEVTLAPEEPARLLHTNWDANEPDRWSLKEIDAGPDYVAAIAVEGRDYELSCWEFEETMLERR